MCSPMSVDSLILVLIQRTSFPKLLKQAGRLCFSLCRAAQALYLADVLDEDAIVSWAAKTKAAAAREAAEPMLRWLQDAEEEEEDSD